VVRLRGARRERRDLERAGDQIPNAVVAMEADEDRGSGNGVPQAVAEPVEVSGQAACMEAKRTAAGRVVRQYARLPARRDAHRAIALAPARIADDERALCAEDPAMQGVCDRDEIRPTPEGDRCSARDRGEQTIDRVVHQGPLLRG
jgi:hypothetical protein